MTVASAAAIPIAAQGRTKGGVTMGFGLGSYAAPGDGYLRRSVIGQASTTKAGIGIIIEVAPLHHTGY